MNKFFKNLNWIHFLSSRLSFFDSKSRLAFTRIIPAIGIGFGVMVLIIIIAVMNGFQGTSIKSLMEINSYHVRIYENSSSVNEDLISELSKIEDVKTVIPVCEMQGLLVGKRGRQQASFIRGLDPLVLEKDSGFKNEIKIVEGSFNLTELNSICLGTQLARSLSVKIGDEVSILALAGNSDVDLFSDNRNFTVTGIFECSFSEINETFAFTSIETATLMLGKGSDIFYGVKLFEENKDGIFIQNLKEDFENLTFESWKVINKSFFGALKIEKNILLLLVLLIFLVVGINIYNGMRKMVFERKEDICVLNALGASKKNIQFTFVLQGLYVGLAGSIPGMILGLLVSVNIGYVFKLLANLSYYFSYFTTLIFSPEKAMFVTQNFAYLYYSSIPAVINFGEVFYITIFGIVSAVLSSYIASRKVLSFQIAEVLHDE